jgi:hypothetical protein
MREDLVHTSGHYAIKDAYYDISICQLSKSPQIPPFPSAETVLSIMIIIAKLLYLAISTNTKEQKE